MMTAGGDDVITYVLSATSACDVTASDVIAVDGDVISRRRRRHSGIVHLHGVVNTVIFFLYHSRGIFIIVIIITSRVFFGAAGWPAGMREVFIGRPGRRQVLIGGWQGKWNLLIGWPGRGRDVPVGC
jgi:hypothetical protein